MRDELKKQLRLHEDEKLFPYKDTKNNITIGVGRNLTTNGISLAESDIMLDNDIDICIAELTKEFPWFLKLDEIRQRVLIDMCFNLGLGGLLTFHNTLDLIAKGNYKTAADNMLRSLWSVQVGERAKRLAEMMKTGKDYK